MTGIIPNRPITFMNPQNKESESKCTVSEVDHQKLLNIESLQKHLNKFHNGIYEKVSNHREKATATQNKSTNIIQHKFEVGNFELVLCAGD